MNKHLRSIRSVAAGSEPATQEVVTRRRPFRLVVLIAAASLIGSVVGVLGLATSAYAADTSSTVVSPTNSSIVLGATTTASATVTGDATFGSPTGSVTFYVCAPGSGAPPCTSTADPVGSSVGVTAGPDNTSAASSVSFTPTSTGTWCFAADYSGDTNYSASADTSSAGCFDVTVASAPTVSAPTSPSVVFGSGNSDGATVTGNAAGGSPTGTVTFYACGPTSGAPPCTSIADPVGTPVNVSAGPSNTATASSVSFTPTSTGTWCFAADYSGDTNYSASADTSADECFDVTTINSPTVTTPTSSGIVLGESNSDNAVITGNAVGGNPTGTVSFYACGPTSGAPPCTSVADPVGTPVNVSAGAGDTATASSVSFTPTSAGTWCFAGVYSGDSNYSSTSDTGSDECFTVAQAPSTTTTVPSTSTIALGASVHDGATVTGNAAGGSPTGKVTFYQCGPTRPPPTARPSPTPWAAR